MATITHTQTLWSTDVLELGQTSLISISGGGPNPNLVITDSVTSNVLTMTLTSSILAPSDFTIQHVSSAQRYSQAGINGQIRNLDRATILRICDNVGTISTSEATYFDGSGFFGDLTNILAINQNGTDFVFVTDYANGGIVTLRADAQGNLSERSSIVDDGAHAFAKMSSLASVKVYEQTYILGASQTENALNVFRVGANGELTYVSGLGLENLLPVDLPTDIDIVVSGNQTFVLMTSYGTNSLTVFELFSDGVLNFVSQAVDTLDTRFRGAKSLDTIQIDGQTFVVVAGNDGGLSVFRLLPNGQLLISDTIVDTTDMALQNVQHVEFVQVEGQVEIWAYATGDKGLSRLSADFGMSGITATGQNGTAHNDILTFAGVGGTINGFAGDDLLIESVGNDTMIGGAGADVFVFSNLSGSDIIQDFNVLEDKIDFSAIKGLSSFADLAISVSSGHVILSYQNKTWTIQYGANQTPTLAQLSAAITFSTGRVFMEEKVIARLNEVVGDGNANNLWGTSQDDRILGLAGNDVFHWSAGADIFNGSAGNDLVSYLNATQSAIINLADSASAAGAAAGDTYISIETIEGSQFSDLITGDSAANRFLGGGGNDQMFGGAGSDILIGGAGADVLNGGEGTDTASYATSTTAQYIDLQVSGLNSGTEALGDTYSSIENLIGGSGSDTIRGNAGNNFISGGAGNDLIVGRHGNDVLQGAAGNDILVGGLGADALKGGAGTDIASYATSTTGQYIDLQVVGVNTGAEALGDTYSDIENLVGGSGSDDIRGDDGDNVINGGSGYDLISGREGDDTLLGGLGGDTLDGGDGNDVLNGGSGDDRLLGQNGDDRLVGAVGDDMLIDYSGDNVMLGDEGADILFDGIGNSSLFGGDGNDQMKGAGGDDQLYGGAGNDFLNGGAGNDILRGDQGDDFILGGAGADNFVFQANTGADIVADISLAEDHLLLSIGLTKGVTDPAEIVNQFASIVGGKTILDFGDGDSIVLVGVTNMSALSDMILVS